MSLVDERPGAVGAQPLGVLGILSKNDAIVTIPCFNSCNTLTILYRHSDNTITRSAKLLIHFLLQGGDRLHLVHVRPVEHHDVGDSAKSKVSLFNSIHNGRGSNRSLTFEASSQIGAPPHIAPSTRDYRRIHVYISCASTKPSP